MLTILSLSIIKITYLKTFFKTLFCFFNTFICLFLHDCSP